MSASRSKPATRQQPLQGSRGPRMSCGSQTRIQRVTGVPMEPRTVIGEYDTASGCYTLHSGSGRGVSKLRIDLAQVLGVAPERVRVVCGDMGGNFGTRNFFYPEYALLPWAARRIGRPVKWTCERRRGFLRATTRAATSTVEAELALDADGNFLAVQEPQPEQSRGAGRLVRVVAEGTWSAVRASTMSPPRMPAAAAP